MTHRAHDYVHLVHRWRTVAKHAGLKLVRFATAGKFDVFFLHTKSAATGGGLYLSAGIHGDEAGATEGLIAWAEKHADTLASLPIFILPCLNPWGLTQNCRYDERGKDLNRAFDRSHSPVITALRAGLRGQRFHLGLALHEDYDGQGIYLYEGLRGQAQLGERLLAAVERIIPIDPRTRIDICRPKRGVVRRRFDMSRYERLGGLPEAVWLHRDLTQHTITFETPSEFALERRIAAHVAVIEACMAEVIAR